MNVYPNKLDLRWGFFMQLYTRYYLLTHTSTMIFYSNSYYQGEKKMNREERGEGKIYRPLIFLYFLLQYEIQGG